MTIHACPRCGNTNIAYDYIATATIRVIDGVIDYAIVAAPFDGQPIHLFCGHCTLDYSVATEAQLDALEALVADTIAAPGDEMILYQR